MENENIVLITRVQIPDHARSRIFQRMTGIGYDLARDLTDMAFSYGTSWDSEPDWELSEFIRSKQNEAERYGRIVRYFLGYVYIFDWDATTNKNVPILVTVYKYSTRKKHHKK